MQMLLVKDKEIDLLKRELELTRMASASGLSLNSGYLSQGFYFKDVEESLNTFSGDDNYSIEKWLLEFKQSAEVFE